MDAGMVFFFCFLVVVFAIVMGTVKEVAKRAIALKEKQIDAERAAAQTALPDDVAARLGTMEQRLRVLERIATDGNTDTAATLAREIEALRGVRANVPSASSGLPLNLKERAL